MKNHHLQIVFGLLVTSTLADEVPAELEKLSQKQIRGGVEVRKVWAKEKEKAEPGYIVVKSSGVAWVYKSPPHTGRGHGDGVAQFKLSGFVADTGYQPIKGARILEKPTRQFGGVKETKEQATTAANGSFSFNASVGAAISMGDYGGDVYQSGFKTFMIVCEGYKSLEVTVGYACPELYIQLSKDVGKTGD